jgi:hypothetical protein
MLRLLAMPLVALSLGTGTSIQPLPAPVQAELTPRFWQEGCPVRLAHALLLQRPLAGGGPPEPG